MGDGEGRIEDQAGRVTPTTNLFGPDVAGKIEHDAAPIALAVHVASPVEHLLKRHEGVLDYLVIPLAVFADRRVCSSGNVVERHDNRSRTYGLLVLLQQGSVPSFGGLDQDLP